ncbi:MAG: S1 RNA-binding domain-containing protein, partial [Patescibacteria group bacterium]
IKNFVATLKPGDKVLAHVISPENEKEQMILSIRNSMQSTRWQTFFDLLKSGEVVTVRPLEVNKGGLLVDYSGIRGFIPTSQLAGQQNVSNYLNRPLQVKVIEVDQKQNRLVFSEKAITAAAEKEERLAKISGIKFGDKYKGTISSITNFGMFVTLDPPAGGGAEGLVHISEVSWDKVGDLTLKYKINDSVDVVALSVNDSDGKLNLSIKRLTEDPFIKAAEGLKVDQKVKGKVVRISSNGAYVALDKGVEGLMKVVAGKSYEIGDEVTATVESVDTKLRKITLSPVLTKKFVGYK